MKKFIRKFSFFCFSLAIYFSTNCIVNIILIKRSVPKLTYTNILIVGDSHTQKSLNPKLLGSAQNISQPAEPYVLTFWKLKQIFKSYKPDTLILGFAHHNISLFYDLKFSDRNWAPEMFRRSYTMQRYNDIDCCVKIDYNLYYQTLFHQIGFYPKTDHVQYIGKYSNSNKNKVNDWKIAANRHFYYENGSSYETSTIMLNYLDSIVNFTLENNVKLIMVSNPLDTNYRNQIPHDIDKVYEQLKFYYGKKAIIYDKSNDSYPDTYFLNADHLNSRGAEMFTKGLIEYLKK
ncbi:hypothetical protein LVD15_16205 [Fulvivirga maritima]|uniref:hypothetical protein n=1 Tax=Fulvivirga maritima TaxID=2904247 RepID=UPI001F2DDCD8|nr:hypothetical protein [Fulvivirga maritima]UII24844.1 hypothetical protein LVD15_16205 [Fulvivirga maritima]